MGATIEQGSDAYDWEKPSHSVTLSDYYIGKYEVTQELWEAVMGNNPSYFKGDNNPVETVKWYDAIEYCNKLSQKEGLTPCYIGSGDSIKFNPNANGYRLPTETEWVFAARGGNKSKGFKYSGSNNFGDLGDVAWYDNNSDNKTHPIKQKLPNELGIYDMSGNVWEWCWNTWSEGSFFRVIRGGSWGSYDYYCTVSYRFSSNPKFRGNDLGFRVCRSL